VRGVLLMLSAMLAHSIWDNMSTYGYAIAGVFGLRAAHGRDGRRRAVPAEQARLHAILAPEVERGVLTDDEARAAAGGRKTRKAYRRSMHGHRAKQTAARAGRRA
jgi:hypothetical protein